MSFVIKCKVVVKIGAAVKFIGHHKLTCFNYAFVLVSNLFFKTVANDHNMIGLTGFQVLEYKMGTGHIPLQYYAMIL